MSMRKDSCKVLLNSCAPILLPRLLNNSCPKEWIRGSESKIRTTAPAIHRSISLGTFFNLTNKSFHNFNTSSLNSNEGYANVSIKGNLTSAEFQDTPDFSI